MNEFEIGILNSDLVLNYLFRNKNSFTLYLEDGAKLSGTLLGWDADFLLLKEGKFLHMVRLSRISRLQADLEQITQAGSDVKREKSISTPVEAPKVNTLTSTSSPFAKLKPTLAEVKTPPASNENNSSAEKEDFKDRLDQLVRNW
jgi:sRNA-binding regulator protein Hfq